MRTTGWMLLVGTMAAAGCGDFRDPVSVPVGDSGVVAVPRTNSLSTEHLTVAGFTTNAFFHRWTQAPTWFVTGQYTFYWNRVVGLDSVKVKRMVNGGLMSMNGGETYVSFTVDGVTQAIGSVSGDFEQGLTLFEIPTGGVATLLAHPDDGCTFLFWEDEFKTRFFGNPHQVSNFYGPDLTRTAWFQCGSLHPNP